MGDFEYTGDKVVQPEVDGSEDSADLGDLDNDAVESEDDGSPSDDFDHDSEEFSTPMNASAKPAKVTPKPAAPAKVVAAPPVAGEFTPEQQAAVQAEVLRIAGADTILRVKGVDRKLSDLRPEEIPMLLQKGIRADQLWQEAASERKKIAEERELVERGARVVQNLLDQQQRGGGREESAEQIPEYLRPNPDDSDEVRFYKTQQLELMGKVKTMEKSFQDAEQAQKEGAFVGELKSLQREFPMASMDEIVAIKSARPDLNTALLVQKSHEYYSSSDFIEKAFKANPTALREFEERIVQNYLARKQGSKKVPGLPATSGSSKNVSERPRPRITDFNSADSYARKHVEDAQRAERD